MSKTNHGTIDVTIGTEVHVLKPTLKAVKAIENRFGGIVPAMNDLTRMSVQGVAFIVAVGTGVNVNKPKDLEEVEQAVFDSGAAEVISQVIPYLSALLNPAGKTEKELEEAEASGNE